MNSVIGSWRYATARSGPTFDVLSRTAERAAAHAIYDGARARDGSAATRLRTTIIRQLVQKGLGVHARAELLRGSLLGGRDQRPRAESRPRRAALRPERHVPCRRRLPDIRLFVYPRGLPDRLRRQPRFPQARRSTLEASRWGRLRLGILARTATPKAATFATCYATIKIPSLAC